MCHFFQLIWLQCAVAIVLNVHQQVYHCYVTTAMLMATKLMTFLGFIQKR